MKRNKDRNTRKPRRRGWLPLAILGRLLLIGLCALLVLTTLWLLKATPAWETMEAVTWKTATEALRQVAENHVFRKALHNSLMDLLVIGVGGLMAAYLIAWGLSGLPVGLRCVPIALLCLPSLTGGWLFAVTNFFDAMRHGLLNALLLTAGKLDKPVSWLSDPAYMALIVRGIQLFRAVGPAVLVISAGFEGARRRVADEAFSQKVRGSLSSFWRLTLPALRMPLMLAAALTATASLGTAQIAGSVLNATTVPSYDGYPLWLHVEALCGAGEALKAAAAALLTLLFLVVAVAVLCVLIVLLTWRSRKAVHRARPVPACRRRRSVVGVFVGLLVGLLCFAIAAVPFVRLGAMSLMRHSEITSATPCFLPAKPDLACYQTLFNKLSAACGTAQLPEALYTVVGAAAVLALGWGVGLCLSQKPNRLQRALLVLLVMAAALSHPGVRLLTVESAPETPVNTATFAVLMRQLQLLLPLSCLLGLSLGAICRGRSTRVRLLAVLVGCVCACLLPVWTETMTLLEPTWRGNTLYRAAGYMLVDMLPLLLCYPLTAGLFQIVSGANAARR